MKRGWGATNTKAHSQGQAKQLEGEDTTPTPTLVEGKPSRGEGCNAEQHKGKTIVASMVYVSAEKEERWPSGNEERMRIKDSRGKLRAIICILATEGSSALRNATEKRQDVNLVWTSDVLKAT